MTLTRGINTSGTGKPKVGQKQAVKNLSAGTGINLTGSSSGGQVVSLDPTVITGVSSVSGTGGVTVSPTTGDTVASLSTVTDGKLLSNISGGTASPTGNTLSAIIDHILGSTQGSILYRNASNWVVLTPGTSGQFLETLGAAANPTWATVSGTLSAIADGDLLANTSGSSAVPVATTLTHLIDYAIGSTQGDILYRNASAWVVLAPGTSGQVLQTNGAAANPSWVTPTVGATPAIVLITETVTSSSASSVTFSSISSSYRDLILKVRGRGDTAATNVVIQVQFNADTGANYDYFWGGGGSSYGATQAFGQTSAQIGALSAASAPSNDASAIVIDLLDYRGTTFNKDYLGQWSQFLANTSGNIYSIPSSGKWRSTSAINSIKVFTAAGNFVDNSVVSLYGSL